MSKECVRETELRAYASGLHDARVALDGLGYHEASASLRETEIMAWEAYEHAREERSEP